MRSHFSFLATGARECRVDLSRVSRVGVKAARRDCFSNYYHKHVSLKLYMTQVTHPTAPFTSTPCGRRAPGTLQTARPCYLGGPAPRPGPGSEFSEPTVAILATSLGGG